MLPPAPARAPRDTDAAVRSTDSDAAQARLSAISKGYLFDQFAHHLVPRARFATPRPPLINHGTHVRATALDALVDEWLATGGVDVKKQIISVGAGSDSRFWRISTGPLKDALHAYLEVDLPENTLAKAMAIRKSKELSAVLGDNVTLTLGGQGLESPRYVLAPVDLREDPAQTLQPFITRGILDPSIPTLIVAECVLVYMDRAASDRVLRWAANTFDVAGGLVYEMFGLNDGFGRVMRENLLVRNVLLPGVDAYPTLHDQAARFRQTGFVTAQRALSLRTIRATHISAGERARIAQLEMLDEVEELELVLAHYVIAFGVKASDPESPFASWNLPAALPVVR
ncbi:leucine carboxyl methyltransferase [Exidia glandulosa HHB12029]|uniref:Leucine carboxyl methyltransferase 1 n=1 Tax=Exidia glandulosa HHB12029 TaxID=1314781 RepID=A0A165DC49_EXIGL|nr:leucine carboxyl methyltransferase [Exidia glandulosa HHB12029]